MSPRILKVWQGVACDGKPSIRLDWSNDRHHEVIITGAGDVDDVANALILLAHIIKRDIHLKTGDK